MVWEYKKSTKISLALTYIFMVALAVIAVLLPWMVTWYAETMGRSQRLAATVMLTCYPCVPFAVVMLVSIRKVLKNLLNDIILSEQNISCLRRVSWCCLIAGVIMLIAGNFYLPFFIAGGAAVVCALIVRVIKNLLHFLMEQNNKEDISEEEK